MDDLIKISLRQQAIYLPKEVRLNEVVEIQKHTALFSTNLIKLGFGLSEELLKALNQTTPTFQAKILEIFREVMAVNKNWTPLVKGWGTPTGESVIDHIVTLFANVFKTKGVTLPCGHIIPPHTFPLERYNGCPFCGTPFEFGEIENFAQGSKVKVLELWNIDDVDGFLKDLLTSKTALDATQIDSLKVLLRKRSIPQVKIGMKETLMTVVDAFIENGEAEKAGNLFRAPGDILRYLWYKHTGFLQIMRPRNIVKRKAVNQAHIGANSDGSAQTLISAKAALKLKYGRKTSRMVAQWLNNLALEPEQMAEMMHPKRGMWVRFIRALRLSEYSKREGFKSLKALLDVFHNQTYQVWQGRVDHFRLKSDADETMALLKQRPGLFARSLFANMLWFGPEKPLAAFAEVIDKVPARLVFTLNMYAGNYFNPKMQRTVKPLGGNAKMIPPHALLKMYDRDQLEAMQTGIEELCVLAMKKRFASVSNPNKTIYIDPVLYKMPVAIGDRSDQIQDLPVALMGTRFPIEGNVIRLFLRWGEGLPAMHLDMDLSCYTTFPNKSEICSYSKLTNTGTQHSGDIRSIPELVGTAEYINIDLRKLKNAGAKYVLFTCNAYSSGELTPNLVVGWMDSKHEMKISETTGVAYDPSCVQHQVRITQGLTKGLLFGMLDLAKSEVIWLEMPFAGQVVQNLDNRVAEGLLAKLDSKLNIGNLLKLKAEAQGLELVESAEGADEVYNRKWAMNAASVSQLLVD